LQFFFEKFNTDLKADPSNTSCPPTSPGPPILGCCKNPESSSFVKSPIWPPAAHVEHSSWHKH
jgi:hypothetical protein